MLYIQSIQLIIININMAFCEHQIGTFSSTIFSNYLGMRVWELRHLEVSRFIQHNHITKVFDIGCSDGRLINRLSRSSSIKLLVGIDIDNKAFEDARQNAQPQMIQHELSFMRQEPLIIKLYHGDIFNVIPPQAHGVQLITMIQFIEHLHESKLQSLAEIVFKQIKPQFIMITTPNAEFNYWFNFKQGEMRHPDHKYEWGRAKFGQYCESVSQKYGYTYEISGIGDHINNDKYGKCSQCAKFTRITGHKQQQQTQTQIMSPEQVVEIKYPFWREHIAKIYNSQLMNKISSNNYGTLDQICSFFMKTKICKKLKQFPSQNFVPCIINNQKLVNQIGSISVLHPQFIVFYINNCLQNCWYDQPNDMVCYQYDEDNSMDEDDKNFWMEKEREFAEYKKSEEYLSQQNATRVRKPIEAKKVSANQKENVYIPTQQGEGYW